MKYIIIPIFRFIIFLIGGLLWCIINGFNIIWHIKWKIYVVFYKNPMYFENTTYKTPLDYLLERNSYNSKDDERMPDWNLF